MKFMLITDTLGINNIEYFLSYEEFKITVMDVMTDANKDELRIHLVLTDKNTFDEINDADGHVEYFDDFEHLHYPENVIDMQDWILFNR